MSSVQGSMNGSAKLTEDDVTLIRKCADERSNLTARIAELNASIVAVKREKAALSSRQLAEKFGVSLRVINSILYGSAWIHVP